MPAAVVSNRPDFRTLARAKGYTDEEIEAFLASKGIQGGTAGAPTVSEDTSIQVAPPSEEKPKEEDKGFVGNLISNIAKQALGGLKLGGEVVGQLGVTALPGGPQDQGSMEQKFRAEHPTLFMSEEELKPYSNVKDVGDFTNAAVEASKEIGRAHV